MWKESIVEDGCAGSGWSADRLNERPPFDCDVVDEERITGGVAFQAEADLGHSSAHANGSECLEVGGAIGIRSSGGFGPHCLPGTVEYLDGGYIIATDSIQVKAKGQGCLIQRNS